MKTKYLFLLLPLLLTGCFFGQSQTQYYDLARPPKIDSVPISVANFTSISGERFRMAYRTGATSVKGLDFHKWIQPPGTMLTRYLTLAFRNDDKEQISPQTYKVTLSGEILLFEYNQGNAEMGIRYRLQYKTSIISKTVLLTEKVKKVDVKNFADAMSLNAEKFARMAAQEAAGLVKGK